MNFKGKTVLITGVACGTGRAAAIKFAQGGANLALVDLDMNKLQDVKKEAETYTINADIRQRREKSV